MVAIKKKKKGLFIFIMCHGYVWYKLGIILFIPGRISELFRQEKMHRYSKYSNAISSSGLF